jgi:hypothetical protein
MGKCVVTFLHPHVIHSHKIGAVSVTQTLFDHLYPNIYSSVTECNVVCIRKTN